jgi:hypothetical protein
MNDNPAPEISPELTNGIAVYRWDCGFLTVILLRLRRRSVRGSWGGRPADANPDVSLAKGRPKARISGD